SPSVSCSCPYLSYHLCRPLHDPFVLFKFASESPGCPRFLLTCLFVDPLGGRLDLRSWLVSRVFSPASRETAYCTNRHVLIANDLTAQPDARQAPRRQYVTLSDSPA